MDKNSSVFVAGHRGLVGSALLRHLEAKGFSKIIVRTSAELDLRDPHAVRDFFGEIRPEYVFLCAAKVGGIGANTQHPVEFIRDNLYIQSNVIDSAYHNGCRKLLFLGSSCIYPKTAPIPIQESSLLSGPLEPTNEPYAIAKIAGIRMVQAFRDQYGFNGISIMPTNLYGPKDNFNLETSHVLPALMRRFHEAKIENHPEVTLWGTGAPLREFLHADDLADASVFLMNHYDDREIVNVGTGEDLPIRELAELISKIVGYKGSIAYDPSRPNGTMRKLLDVSKIHAMGWKAKIELEQGLESTYAWYKGHSHQASFRKA